MRTNGLMRRRRARWREGLVMEGFGGRHAAARQITEKLRRGDTTQITAAQGELRLGAAAAAAISCLSDTAAARRWPRVRDSGVISMTHPSSMMHCARRSMLCIAHGDATHTREWPSCIACTTYGGGARTQTPHFCLTCAGSRRRARSGTRRRTPARSRSGSRDAGTRTARRPARTLAEGRCAARLACALVGSL